MLQTLTGRHTIPAEGGGGATGLVGEETMMLGPVMVMDNGREVVKGMGKRGVSKKREGMRREIRMEYNDNVGSQKIFRRPGHG